MKIRNGFVSNSSSASFIIVNPNDEIIDYLHDNMIDYLDVSDLLFNPIGENILITKIMSDCSDEYIELIELQGRNCDIECYAEGSCDEPYEKKDFEEFEGVLGHEIIYINKGDIKYED